MPTQDSPISLLSPAASLTGAEIFPLVQGGVTVRDTLNDIKTFILSSVVVGTGDITGSGTSGKIPLFNAAKNIVNSRITQTLTTINIPSPNGSAYLKVEDDAISMEVLDAFYHRVYIDETKVGLAYYDGVSVGGGVESNVIYSILYHDSRAVISAPNIQFPTLTGNTVPYLDTNQYMRSSGVTLANLNTISTARSDLQVQIDALYSNLSWKQEVACATTANITLSGLQTIDGYTTLAEDRVLVKDQSTASQNCIYIAKTGSWVRATDCDSTSEIVSATVQVRFGTTNKDTQWSCSNTNQPVIGTDAITFVKINGGNVYVAGVGLTLTGNSFSIGSGQVVNSMIANNSIDLTAKVTNTLKQLNGGTGVAINPAISSIPFQNTETAYGYDQANFSYDSYLKTLGINNIYVSPDDGITGVVIEGASNLLRLVTTDAGYDAAIIQALGNGLKVDSASGTAGRFTSSENPGEFNQTGVLSADVDYEGVVINRQFTRPASGGGSTAKATGPLLFVNDSTGALGTGDLACFQKQGTKRFRVNNDGKIVYTPGSEAANSYLVDDGTGAGIAVWSRISTFGLPSVTYANTTTTNTDTNIITCVIPANTLTANTDKVVYDFVIGNTGGISGDVTYKVKINATSLLNDKTVTLNANSDPITLRVTIERLTSSTFRYTLQYNFSTHTTSLRTVEYNTITGFDFTTASTLYIVGNQLSTTRGIIGVEGHGVYYKAS